MDRQIDMKQKRYELINHDCEHLGDHGGVGGLWDSDLVTSDISMQSTYVVGLGVGMCNLRNLADLDNGL